MLPPRPLTRRPRRTSRARRTSRLRGTLRPRTVRRSNGAFRSRRTLRAFAALLLTALALMLTTDQAVAEGLEFGSIELPSMSLASLASWFTDPQWGKLPHQQSGTAAGHRHQVGAAATTAHRGAGHAPGKGKGELPAYQAHKPPRRRAEAPAARASTPRPASAAPPSPRARTPSTTTPTVPSPVRCPRARSTTRPARADGRPSTWTCGPVPTGAGTRRPTPSTLTSPPRPPTPR